MGQRLAQQISNRIGVSLRATARSKPAGLLPVLPKSTRFIACDLNQSAKRIAAFGKWVIYLAPPPNTGADDPRMKHYLAAARHVKRCVYVSTSGVYGAAAGGWVTETSPLKPTEMRGERRVAAEQRLKRSAIAHTTILRAPGIYAAQRLPLERIRSGQPALIAADDVPTNHIHADDLARLCWLALFKSRNRRAYNAADGQPMMHADYLQAVALAHGLTPPARLPIDGVKAAISPAQWSMLAGARRVSNQRLLNEFKVRLRYENVTAFLQTTKSV